MFKTTLQRGSLTPLMSSIRGTAKGVKILNPSADLLPYKGEPVTNKPVKVDSLEFWQFRILIQYLFFDIKFFNFEFENHYHQLIQVQTLGG
nr:unnamed protein product [Haemonchus contortus]